MLSCIICSRKVDIPLELKKNIATTIGCKYELIVIDNSRNEYSIFSAYNEGVRRAKGDILCFMHEDILYHTTNWGSGVLKYFDEYKTVGLIGVVGTHYLCSVPSGWWGTKIASAHLLRGSYDCNGIYSCEEVNDNFYKKTPTQVVTIDGLWMCMPRVLFKEVSWDERILGGYHGYDLDMSLQVWNKGKEVHIYWDVLIEHKSMGNAGLDFHEAYEKLWVKWRKLLPIIKGVEIPNTEQELRTYIVKLERDLRMQEFKIRSSKPYRLGKVILAPFTFVKQMKERIKRPQ